LPGREPEDHGAELFALFDARFQETRPYFAKLVAALTE
jgi:hypothetical protein